MERPDDRGMKPAATGAALRPEGAAPTPRGLEEAGATFERGRAQAASAAAAPESAPESATAAASSAAARASRSRTTAGAWREEYEGGSPEAERLLFEELARDLMRVQVKNKQKSKAAEVQRAFHAKPVLAVANARLQIRPDLPAELQVGFMQPGAVYPTIVRLSNASGMHQPDPAADMRGAALRVQVTPEVSHDLLMTNFPVSHAKDAREFVAFARAMAGRRTRLAKAYGVFVRLPLAVGWKTATRMRKNVQAGTRHTVTSLALETYWSRGAILWGEAGPVRYLIRPAPGAVYAPKPKDPDPSYLRRELAARLRSQDVVFDLFIQRYVDRERTPIEDGSVEWLEESAPPEAVAQLVIPKQDIDLAPARAVERQIEAMVFSPWHTTDEFRPLGNLNRARKAAYEASSAHRLSYRFVTETPLRNRLFGGLARAAFAGLNRFIPWHRLPLQMSLLNLLAFRHTLRQKNLIDTEVREAPPKAQPVPSTIEESVRTYRTYDGTYNDLAFPKMGAVGAAFGRNLKPVYRPDLFDEPNPVVVSRELLDRKAFIPARSLNILAAAWIQFQVHDWVNHARHKPGEKDIVVPMPPGMTWRNRRGGPEEREMRFADNIAANPAGVAQGEAPILFSNEASHWWDGSEVYGPDIQSARQLRSGVDGKLELQDDGRYLPVNTKGFEVTGFNESWWLGLSAMHTLFAREHNAICAALKAQYRHFDDERLYQTARLVVSALIAKIHTVEWTPAILATKAIEIGLRSNWSGPPQNWLTQLGLWLTEAHALTGIPKTLPDHHTAPYSLTEDFVTVYRMHPLIPDDYELFDHQTGQHLGSHGFLDIQGEGTDELMRQTGLSNTMYSFGTAHPGAITLHNYPRSLQAFPRDGEMIDLSVIDLVRTRRRGVPRYNDFRAGLQRGRVKRFEDLTSDPESARLLREIYREVDRVDTVVGLFAENPPFGFGFSDTAFRIFILMATRRLQSDRFLTVDFRPEIYTPLGMDWIEQNGMTSVLLRHCPGLAAMLPRTASAFAPWRALAPAPRPVREPVAGDVR